MRYRLTVDRALLDSDPSNPSVIRVEDTQTGAVEHHARVRLLTPTQLVGNALLNEDFEVVDGPQPIITYGPPQQDGARVWIECDAYEAEAACEACDDRGGACPECCTYGFNDSATICGDCGARHVCGDDCG